MRFAPVLIAALVVLAACSGTKKRDRVTFEGVYFKAKVDTTRQDRRGFDVAVQGFSANLAGAREAARYEATRYCLKGFGSSDIDWTLGPDAEDGSLVVVKESLVFTGRCVG